ncbi:hypothetical protein TNCV_3493941 [Trichonephila clavipes]|nr:hypothetical protein TNCV_3493941 [Trichonephila clavipes]
MHRHTSLAPDIMVSCCPLPSELACAMCEAKYFSIHQLTLLPWPTCSLEASFNDLEGLAQHTPSAATPDQLWLHVVAA